MHHKRAVVGGIKGESSSRHPSPQSMDEAAPNQRREQSGYTYDKMLTESKSSHAILVV
jgi:hypothetical protein